MKRIAILYLSKTGTTKEAAEIIKETLESSDYQVDLMEMTTQVSLTDYQGVILGAPINGFKWVPEATAFAESHSTILNQMPTALYAMNYLGEMGRKGTKATILKSFSALKAQLSPLDIRLFGGKIDKALPGPVRVLFGVKNDSPLSAMNPADIQSWAKELTTKF